MSLGRAVAGYHIPAESENVAVPGVQTGLFLAHRREPNTDGRRRSGDVVFVSRRFALGTDARAHTTNVTTREVHGRLSPVRAGKQHGDPLGPRVRVVCASAMSHARHCAPMSMRAARQLHRASDTPRSTSVLIHPFP